MKLKIVFVLSLLIVNPLNIYRTDKRLGQLPGFINDLSRLRYEVPAALYIIPQEDLEKFNNVLAIYKSFQAKRKETVLKLS